MGEAGRTSEDPVFGPSAPTTLKVLRRLDSGPRGLTETQAQERLARHGETLQARHGASWPRMFVRSLRDPFTPVRLCPGAGVGRRLRLENRLGDAPAGRGESSAVAVEEKR
ncbi:cation-transporting P-type ATPase [Streptomyces sp. Li-HN-5-11]|uniref:cation-transporting P-type ATPase n=1 Tax=Streptomyces sp. Li-HN-5-11 TaxID=3075432 RepID=UPI0037DA2D5E